MAFDTSLGTQPIGKLLRQYALPSIVAMTASSVYHTMDSVFIGQGVGALAIAGLSVTFPLMNLAAAFGSLVGVGSGTLVSVKLGQKDYNTVKRVIGNTILLNIAIGLVFTAVTLLFLDPILLFFGATEQTLPYAREYMQIILGGNIVTHLYLGLNSVLRAAGHPRQSMMATLNTVLINLILDPLFIFVFHWGIRGAAVATVIAQLASLLWQFHFFTSKDTILGLNRRNLRFDGKIVRNVIAIGMSPFLMNIASCVIVILINRNLLEYGGDMAVGAFGIVNRMTFFFCMGVMGLNQGMQPIAGYNYGAQQYDRVLKVLRITAMAATIVTTVAFLAGEFAPYYIARAFTSDQDLIEISIVGLRINFLVFPCVGFQMVAGNFFQSIGMAKKAIFLSLTRQVLFLIPMLIVFPKIWGLNGVWYSLPASDTVAFITCTAMLVWQIRQFKKSPQSIKNDL